MAPEEVRWDREQFVQQQQQNKRQAKGLGLSIVGLFLFVITMGVLGGGAYWYLKSQGMAASMPSLPEINLPALISSEPSEEEVTLAKLDERLAQIEKRLGITPPGQKPPATAPRPASARSSQTASRTAPAPAAAAAPPPALTASTVQPASNADPNADREAWEATTDRLGMAVGELGEQRRAIAATRETLDAIRQQMERSSISFEVRRNGGRQPVGPIAIDLQSTDTRNQRYSLRLYFDDRTVQMKDRVLGERVSFYIGGLDDPLELVVSEIAPNMVFGKLAVPPSGSTRSTMSTP
jgi:hypothetical protein